MVEIFDNFFKRCLKFIEAISGWDKLRLIAKPGNDYLFDDLLKIIREVVPADKIDAERGEERNFEGWNVDKITFKSSYWDYASKNSLNEGRMMIGRLVFHFGRQHGWDFLVNGNVKGNFQAITFKKIFYQQALSSLHHF